MSETLRRRRRCRTVARKLLARGLGAILEDLLERSFARRVLGEFVEGQCRFAIIDGGEAREVDGDRQILVLAVLGGERELATLLEAVDVGFVDHELGRAG